MFLKNLIIDRSSPVNEIVKQDHHTADVFRKYDIEYCCGGRWPLEAVCLMKGLEYEVIKTELESVSRHSQLPPMLPYDTWNVDFLTSYIINIHHFYLKNSLPDTGKLVKHFADEHEKKYPFMQEVYMLIEELIKEILPHLQQEEETIFPYICQVAHAYENNDSYGRLLVKTLRKPLSIMMHDEHNKILSPVFRIRELTGNYFLPEKACISHQIALSRLKELDNDLMQHVYLENVILFPKAIQIEQELLK